MPLILASQPPELGFVSKYRVDDDQVGKRKPDKRVAPHSGPTVHRKALHQPEGTTPHRLNSPKA